MDPKFPGRLKEARERLGHTQVEMAKLLEVSRVSLTHYEAGERTPDMDFLKRLVEVTGISPYYFLGISDCKDDAFAAVSDKTGLSEQTIKELQKCPLEAKIINLMIASNSFYSFSKMAAAIHDDHKLIKKAEYKFNEYPIAKSAFKHGFDITLESLSSLTLSMLTELAPDSDELLCDDNPFSPIDSAINILKDARLKLSAQRTEKKEAENEKKTE